MLDLAALHVVAASTLRRLAATGLPRLGDWDPRRLRLNMLIEDDDGPVDEDEWLAGTCTSARAGGRARCRADTTLCDDDTGSG